jgi:RNA polymerase subunit RPABC4/transcription elongation factor Spt4
MSRKTQPLLLPQTRKRCPVCDEVSYSASGIHPQCAMARADVVQTAKNKRSALRHKAKTPAIVTADLKPWHRVCPRCKALVHIRKTTCNCGKSLSRVASNGARKPN